MMIPTLYASTRTFLLVISVAAISQVGHVAGAVSGRSLLSHSGEGVSVSLATAATTTTSQGDDTTHSNTNNRLGLWLLPSRGGSASITTKRGKKNRNDDKVGDTTDEKSAPDAPVRRSPPPRRLWLRSSQKSSNQVEQEKEKQEQPPPSKVVDDEEKEKKKAWGMFGRKQDEQNIGNSSSTVDSTKQQRKKGGVEVLHLKSNKKETKTDKKSPPPPSSPPATDNKTTNIPSSSTTTNKTVDSLAEESLSTNNNNNSSTTTTTTTTVPASPSSQEEAAPNIIVLGAPPGSSSTGGQPYRIIRPRPGSSSSSPAGGILIPPPGGPGSGRPVSQNTVILAEILANLLGTVLRLWFITFVTRRLSQQEETIHHVQHFVWERLNDSYVRDVAALQTIVQEPPLGVGRWWWKQRHIQGSYQPPKRDLTKTFTRTVVVFTVHSNDKGGLDLDFLSSVVTFLLTQHRAHAFGTQPLPPPPPGYYKRKRQLSGQNNNNNINSTSDDDDTTNERPPPPSPMELEVVMLVQSPGGAVTTYGLAAAQVRRLAQEAGISVTVCVDKYAASGGYMIASQAHKLIAAPFATIGSVGVIMEGLNFYELARRYGIQPVILKAGESKNPFSLYGPISKQDERIEKERLEKVHQAFKELIVHGRPLLASRLGTVADGSIFLGQEALDVDLVDQVQTSDEYILERIQAGDRVLKLHKSMQPRLSRRFLSPQISPLDILPHLRSWIRDQVQLLLGGDDDNVESRHVSSTANGSVAASAPITRTKSNRTLILALAGLWSIAQFWFQRVNVPVRE